jgi:hypothetical protein
MAVFGSNSANPGVPSGTPIANSGNISTTTTGEKEGTINITLQPGIYWLAIQCSSAITVTGEDIAGKTTSVAMLGSSSGATGEESPGGGGVGPMGGGEAPAPPSAAPSGGGEEPLSESKSKKSKILGMLGEEKEDFNILFDMERAQQNIYEIENKLNDILND